MESPPSATGGPAERPGSAGSRSGGAEIPALWLHARHGTQAANLTPLEAPRRDDRLSAAQAFAAEASLAPRAGGSSILGVPCQIRGIQLTTATGEPVTPLFLTEVSSAPLLVPGLPDAAVIAIVPPPGGAGLRGTAAGGGDNRATASWFVLVQGGHETLYVALDQFSRAGSLRSGLEKAYSALPESDAVIGEGAYATVMCMSSRDGTPVAVKNMKPSVELEAIEREIATLLNVQQHDHIVGYRGIFWHREQDGVNRISVVFDVAPCGDLLYKILKYGMMTEATAKPLFQGIVKGLSYLHAQNIVHRDIKAENILLKREDCAIVADFGLATWITDEVQMARRCGSPGYVAPEVCLGTPYDYKVDVFGAGIILYFMLSKEMPFSSPDRDTAATMRRTVKCNLHLHRPPWDAMSIRLRNILRQMICKSPEERLSAAAVLQHPWMTSSSSRDRSHADRAALQASSERFDRKLASIPESRGNMAAMPPQGPPAPATGYPAGPGPPEAQAPCSGSYANGDGPRS